MNVVFIHGSSLTTQRAHWLQILNTAHACARNGATRVVVIPRTFEPGVAEDALAQMGLPQRDNLSITPLISYRDYKAKKLSGDLLSQSQSSSGRRLGLRAIEAHLSDVVANGEETVIVSRDQDIPVTCQGLVSRFDLTTINELHKFEYVKKLEGKLASWPFWRRRLRAFKKLARERRTEELALLSRFDGVVCTTPNIRERLLGFGFRRPSIVLPNGANFDASRASVPSADKDIEILYIGQLYAWKGIDHLVRALVHMPGRRLTVVGGNKESDFVRLRALAAEMQVADRIEFLGHRPYFEVDGFMRRARVGVVPLPRRGFAEARMFCNPLKALEMMAAGTPIIATRLRSLDGLLDHGRNAWLAPPDDPESLAHAINHVLEDEILQESLAREGRVTVADLTYDRRAERLLSFARSLRAGNG